ncbi:hypothetical protein BJ165DRAFT_352206 [Panaeolus papilionaceus]|nr:hypothetical protein BJ165DRAFT_352206 [Panaeolus papilionaceus]
MEIQWVWTKRKWSMYYNSRFGLRTLVCRHDIRSSAGNMVRIRYESWRQKGMGLTIRMVVGIVWETSAWEATHRCKVVLHRYIATEECGSKTGRLHDCITKFPWIASKQPVICNG